MNFIIDSEIFKCITERAAVCSYQKASYLPFWQIKISADQESQSVSVTAGDAITFAKITTDRVKVLHSGTVFIDVNDLKKIYNAKGQISVSSDGESLIVKSDKKKCSIVCRDNEEHFDIPEVNGEMAFRIQKDQLVGILDRLSPCLKRDGKEDDIHSGFHFDSRNHRVVTLDGVRLSLCEADWIYGYTSFTLRGDIEKKLKKVAGKNDCLLTGYLADRYLYITGEDFVYYTKVMDGNYLDVNAVIDSNSKRISFRASLDQLYTAAKEYDSLGKKNMMYMFGHDGKLVTATIHDNYITSDVIDTEDTDEQSAELPDGLITVLNAKFVKELKNILQGKMITAEIVLKNDFTRISNWYFRSDDGYLVLILPCYRRDPSKEEIEVENKICNFVCPKDDRNSIDDLSASA